MWPDYFFEIFGLHRREGSMEKIEIPTGYEILQHHLDSSLDQAARGKGKIRHAQHTQPFDEQIICTIGRLLGSYDFEIGQAIKKIVEAKRIHKLNGPAQAKTELYGAINYLVAACIILDEME